MKNSFEVIVVGAGSMGMSAGYYLARRGIRTLMIDSYDPPHENGSHHGEPRLIRHAYSGGKSYINLALDADRLWRELEAASGHKLLARSGVLNMADQLSGKFITRLPGCAEAGVQVEMLDAAEVHRRWAGITLPESYEAMYEPNAGYLFSEQCIAAYRKLALAEGAMLLPYNPVQHIQADGAGVRVRTRAGEFSADQLIITAGAWFKHLEPFITLPIRSVRKTVGWFRTNASFYDAGTFPGFTLETKEGGYYGFPNINGAGIKIGRHDGGLPWSPGEQAEPFGHLEEDEGDLRRTLSAFLPQSEGELLQGAVCKYELTPDEHFIIDRHPLYANVLLAGGFSGHGFKFASAVGSLLADLVQQVSTTVDLSTFSLSRFNHINS
ncbi:MULTISPECIES: N-methyl-L-tryptophan oxidase [Paenibacillus]|uniref:N-methyl-L-tryptophan oxidase n=1 Tax=Paenibacillus violae TaxID=3077234 RepID=A0ABU3RCK8_9BACL|nr:MULTISPECIES: N-methyl-L-tryptophan oxidase [Paenibacillus]MDU0201811.1 N-methyl-L-tryptophan oxidase [Paenibacillus sp. PFR10]MEC0267810.1 N-methyl-L-tryptophan oxidase [Paenibacillus anseongense]